MNLTIEQLNELGSRFLAFAWPMLWQSSLLILLVLAVDLLLARKVRAAVRHALWLVVLVKLLLPPSLALPTGAAWWLFPVKPAVQAPAPKFEVVTTDAAAPTVSRLPEASVPLALPPARLDRAGWTLLAVGGVSLGLLGWLAYRWGQVIRRVRRAEPAGELANLVGSDPQWLRLTLGYQVKLVEERMSPAVCGLFRPVILLPRLLAERLTAEQLRAVLLHEAMHLRRWDIWTNCAQALLQILYWWHPLVWVANARMRRLREEAVDDAVMLALGGEAEIYAPTLLEVAKLAFRRPLLSLGLVGIMESRSALRQRIERLVAFRPPRRAGLSVASLVGILAFSAVAVPMGPGPVAGGDESASAPAATPPTGRLPQVLLQGEIYRLPPGKLKDLEAGLTAVPLVSQTLPISHATAGSWWSVFFKAGTVPVKGWLATPEQIAMLDSKLTNSIRLKEPGWELIQRPRILTTTGIEALFFVGNDEGGVELDCLPVVRAGQIQLAFTNVLTDRLVGAGSTNQVGGSVVISSHGGLLIEVPNDPNHTMITLTAELLDEGQSARLRPAPVPAAQVDVPKDLRDGKVFYKMGKFADAQDMFAAVLGVDPGNATAMYYLELMASGRTNQVAGITDTNSIAIMPEAWKKTMGKLVRLRLGAVQFKGVPLSVVVRSLVAQSKLADSERSGFDEFGVEMVVGPAAATQMIDPLTGIPFTESWAGNQPKADEIKITVDPGLSNASLKDVLDAVVKGASSPIHYGISADGIVVFQVGIPLDTRTYRVDPPIFEAKVRRQAGAISEGTSTNLSWVLMKLIARAGVDWASPPSKVIGYNFRQGYVFVKATKSDLDIVDKAMQAINQPPLPQVHLKAWFIEVPAGALEGIKGLQLVTNVSPAGITGRLTLKDMLAALRALEALPGAEELGEPEVTLLPGRQVQMRATEAQTVITNILFRGGAIDQNGTGVSTAFSPQKMTMESGPILDVVPQVEPDLYTLDLTTTASVAEFLGYAPVPTNVVGHAATRVETNAAGETADVPLVWPAVQSRTESAHATLYDNQTLVLVLDQAHAKALSFSGQDDWRDANVAEFIRQAKQGRTQVLVFLTATMIDLAGERIHSEDQMPFAQTGFPAQPGH